MSNSQGSAMLRPLRGSGRTKKLRMDSRRRLRLTVIIANDPHIKDICMGIVVGNNECVCRRLREREVPIYNLFFLRNWKGPFSKTLLREEVRDDSPVCRRCRECTRPDEGILMLEVS